MKWIDDRDARHAVNLVLFTMTIIPFPPVDLIAIDNGERVPFGVPDGHSLGAGAISCAISFEAFHSKTPVKNLRSFIEIHGIK